jgi:protease-4
MSLDSDYLVDRRRMRRKLGFWRVAALLAAIVAVLGIAAATAGKDLLLQGQSHIARVQVRGVVTGDRETLEMLDRLAASDSAKGVIVSIDSPGAR